MYKIDFHSFNIKKANRNNSFLRGERFGFVASRGVFWVKLIKKPRSFVFSKHIYINIARKNDYLYNVMSTFQDKLLFLTTVVYTLYGKSSFW